MNEENKNNNPADANQRIDTNTANEPMQDELEIYKKQTEEYLNNWKKERADFINYKKDEAKRMETFVGFANEGLILEFLKIIDNLNLAAKHEASAESIKQIIKKTEGVLKKYDVERIKTDRAFNPELHEAVSTTEFLDPLKQGQETTPREDGGEKIEEVRAGYTMHGKVIRQARVKIVK